MQPEERNKFAERWLDQALGHYSDTEPRPGLESRILANLDTEKAERRAGWGPRFVIVGASAVVCLTVSLALLRRPVAAPTEHVSAASAAISPATGVNSAAPHVAHLRPDERSRRVSETRNPKIAKRSSQRFMAASKEPRQPQFPADMPLSGQQALVIAYIRSTPAEELMRVSAEQREWQQRVESGAKATQLADAPAQTEINQLSLPLLGSGSRQSGEAR